MKWKNLKPQEICAKFEDEGLALALIEHELAPEDEDFWLEHINSCEQCMALIADVLHADASMKGLALEMTKEQSTSRESSMDFFLLGKLEIESDLPEDLFSQDGDLLLAKGTRITPAILDILHSRGIKKVRFRVAPRKAVPKVETKPQPIVTQVKQIEPERVPLAAASPTAASTDVKDSESEPAFVSRDFNDGFFFAGETSKEPRFQRQEYMSLVGKVSHREAIKQDTKKRAMAMLEESLTDLHKGLATNLEPIREIAKDVVNSIVSNEFKTVSLMDLFLFSSRIYSHSFNTLVLFTAIGKAMNFQITELRTAGEAVLLHDIGRVIPLASDEEDKDIYRTHPLRGYRFLMKQGGFNENMLMLILNHHERFDGKGFPRNIVGEKLGVLDQIMVIANVYDQAVSDPVHNVKKDFHSAAQLIYQSPNILVSPEVINAFLNVMGIYPPGTYVKLKSGEEGIVREANYKRPFQPMVTLLKDNMGHDLPDPLDIDLRELEHSSIERALDVAPLLEYQKIV